MTTALEWFTLAGVVVLVGTICVMVHRIDAVLRSAARSVHTIGEESRAMRIHARAVSPGIEAMNQNLYVVAVQLAQLGDAADRLNDGTRP